MEFHDFEPYEPSKSSDYYNEIRDLKRVIHQQKKVIDLQTKQLRLALPYIAQIRYFARETKNYKLSDDIRDEFAKVKVTFTDIPINNNESVAE